jgi:hypothetical protein
MERIGFIALTHPLSRKHTGIVFNSGSLPQMHEKKQFCIYFRRIIAYISSII